MHFTAALSTGAAPADLLTWVDDLALYPQWLPLVTSVTADRSGGETAHRSEAWKVEIRARVGPLARSKRLRMVRTEATDRGAVFERQESDGRSHSAWVLRADVVPTDVGSELVMVLDYSGNLFAPVLEHVLSDEVERARPVLKRLAEAGPSR